MFLFVGFVFVLAMSSYKAPLAPAVPSTEPRHSHVLSAPRSQVHQGRCVHSAADPASAGRRAPPPTQWFKFLMKMHLSFIYLETSTFHIWASLVAQVVKNLPAVWRPGFHPWVRKIPWRRAWQPTPVFLPGESPWTEETGRQQSTGSQGQTRLNN